LWPENRIVEKTKAELEKQLEESRKEIAYYKRLSEESGDIRLRETEELSRLISERKKVQEALQKARNELEKRVEERTAELFRANLVLKQEILERREIEKALRLSEQRFRSLAETTSDWVWEVDRNGVYTYTNPKVWDLLGYEPAEVLGKQPFDFMPLEEKERIRRIFIDIVEYRKPLSQLVNVNLHKDGRRIILETSGVPVFDEEGNYSGYRGIDRDVSERKIKEEEHLRLSKLESTGLLAGGLAHDFNNLLMGIQGYASLALMDLDPSHPNYEKLQRIEENVQSGADLTRQLLGFARGGRYDVKPTDMNDIIAKTSSMFGRTKKEISIYQTYGKDLWPVEVDRGQMEQVFMNLYVNAWQAMPGGGEIHLETERIVLDEVMVIPYAVKPGRYVKISVTDTGIGMDEKTKAQIFDPFFTTKKMGRGTGLGLATVYGIINGHKGMINVHSEPGHGTTFTIYLPASDKEVVKENVVPDKIVEGTETILLTDDEKMVREVSAKMLEFMGYRVYAAGSGQEAIAIYMEKRDEIDLVILDMIMPGMSGGETFNRLREINSEINVLLSSGYSINGQAQEILDHGCKGFLQKPFHLEKLSRKLREMLD
jgi:PAS domain S-box-containing protein